MVQVETDKKLKKYALYYNNNRGLIRIIFDI